ncbi:hypothetical protein GCM10011505_45640 [Tistrella bauzanensis]|uniref:Uncharacterized protein n=1 Tax=Tistrella bauzanensis TaxID=657419 RepID=A0ABQ1J6D7_9PROT|nr:hypothetical protein GCM10011505_45640 [Tistrella bauzanensis]
MPALSRLTRRSAAIAEDCCFQVGAGIKDMFMCGHPRQIIGGGTKPGGERRASAAGGSTRRQPPGQITQYRGGTDE